MAEGVAPIAQELGRREGIPKNETHIFKCKQTQEFCDWAGEEEHATHMPHTCQEIWKLFRDMDDPMCTVIHKSICARITRLKDNREGMA